jgi:hypothetical protein
MSYFTNDELRLIKQEANVRLGEIEDAFEAGDNDLLVAMVAVMIWRRTGTKPDMAPLWNARAGKFRLVADPAPEVAEDDALPPQTAPDANDKSDGPSLVDAETLNGNLGLPASVLSRTGTQG